MTQLWTEILDTPSADNFGDPAGEARSARDATVICPLTDLGLIRASGDDAASFLHNLLTNDVQGMAPDELRRAGFCTPKGRLLADFLVWRDGADYLLQCSADVQPGMLKKLSMYVLRSKVKLTDAGAELAALGLAGDGAVGLLCKLGVEAPAPMRSARFARGTIIGLAEKRFQIIVDRANAATLWQELAGAATRVGPAAWRGLDIAAGIPRITVAVQEQFVPQMVNYELIGGVSFKKGCYPGQEIVARTHYLGKIKKRMLRAALPQQPVADGAPLYAPSTGDQVCGNVVSAATAPGGGIELLAVVPDDVAQQGEIHLGAADGPRLALLTLPYPLA